jgi:hypothetical protein
MVVISSSLVTVFSNRKSHPFFEGGSGLQNIEFEKTMEQLLACGSHGWGIVTHCVGKGLANLSLEFAKRRDAITLFFNNLRLF